MYIREITTQCLLVLCLPLIMTISAANFQESATLPGDIMIGGLFTVYYGENGQCKGEISETSIQALEAVKWVFNRLNEKNYIPELKIGLLALPTCRLTSEANSRAFELITEINNRKFGHNNCTTTSKPIVGIIGPGFSSTAQTTSQIFSHLPSKDRLLQIGYSTTASVLDDKSVYPNFYKVIPSDDTQVKVMIALMKKLQWNHIAIIYENDTYGTEGAKLLNQSAESSEICVAAGYAIPVSITSQVSWQTVTRIISNIKQSSINGVVFFGTSKTANLLLLASKNSPFSENVQFIFSEGVDLKDTVFKDGGQVLDSGKGSYIVSPPKLNMDEFSAHWKSIFTNMNRLRNESKTNPWLVDVFEFYKSCRPEVNLSSTGCNPMTLNEIEEKYRESLSVSYAVRAALLMAKILSNIYVDNCKNTQGSICATFQDIMLKDKGTLISKMNNITINFQTDFPFNITRFQQTELKLRFENNHVTFLPLSFPMYEVYQYRNCLDVSTQFCLLQAGNYTIDQLKMDESIIKDYSSNTYVGTSWPNIAHAVCKPGTKCTPCIAQDLPEKVYYQDGDVLVVGIVPIFNSDTSNPMKCGDIRTSFGLQLAEAFVYTVEKMNEKAGQLSSYFPGKSVGFLILNSCNQPLIIQKKIMDIIENGLMDKNGSRVNVANRIIGFLGAYGSGISIAVSNVFSKFGYVQISYASTAAVLSDRITYPYFLRVATPDDKQSKLIIKLVKETGSNYIQIVYSGETYGIGGRDTLRTEANKSKVCIANEIEVKEGVYNTVLDTLRKNPFAKIIVIFIRSHMNPEFVKVINEYMDYGEFMFIGTEAWGTNMDVIRGNKKLEGSLSLSLEMAEQDSFTKYLQKLNPLTYTSNPWFQTYFENKFSCYFPSSYDKLQPKYGQCDVNLRLASSADFQQELWTPFANNAALALLMGASETLTDICGPKFTSVCTDFKRHPERLVEKIKTQKLDISGKGLEPIFDENGDGSVGYKIYNIQEDPRDKQKLLYVQVGSSPITGQFELKTSQIVYSDNFKLPSVCPNEVKCRLCFPEESTMSGSQTDNFAVSALGVSVGLLLAVIAVLVVVLVIFVRRSSKKVPERNYDSYLNAIHHKYNDEDPDHYSQVGDEQFRSRPIVHVPSKNIEAKSAVSAAAEGASTRERNTYLSFSNDKSNANGEQNSKTHSNEVNNSENKPNKTGSFSY